MGRGARTTTTTTITTLQSVLGMMARDSGVCRATLLTYMKLSFLLKPFTDQEYRFFTEDSWIFWKTRTSNHFCCHERVCCHTIPFRGTSSELYTGAFDARSHNHLLSWRLVLLLVISSILRTKWAFYMRKCHDSRFPFLTPTTIVLSR